jgi:hypothetical protein
VAGNLGTEIVALSIIITIIINLFYLSVF